MFYTYLNKSEVTKLIQSFIDEHMNYEYSFWNSDICTVDDDFIELIEREIDQVNVISCSYDELIIEVSNYLITISMNTIWDKWGITEMGDTI